MSLSLRSCDRCVRIVIDKGSAFVVKEDHSSYDDAAQVPLKRGPMDCCEHRQAAGVAEAPCAVVTLSVTKMGVEI
jgi:hypothetical protein